MESESTPICEICYENITSPHEMSHEAKSAAVPRFWQGCAADKKFCGPCVTQYLKVESDPDCLFCPNPACGDKRMGGTIVRGSENKMRWQLKCQECGLRICKKCGIAHNILMSCESVLDSQFLTWKHSTRLGVKVCPSCKFHIEKTEGCDHMTCRKCRHEFCWKCLSDYRSGCTRANKLVSCKVVAGWMSPRWGASPVTRTMSKTAVTVLALPALGVGAGVGIAGAGCVAAAGCLAVPVVSLLSVVRLLQQGIYLTRRREFPVLVHMPWNRRVSWIESVGDGDGEVGRFLGYQGRYHPSGIFVTRSTLLNIYERNSLKKWLLDGPRPLNCDVNVVMYFIPNGTSKTTLANMLPQFNSLPVTSYPGCTFNIQAEASRNDARNRLECRVISILNDFVEKGLRIPPTHTMNGLLSDPTDYGLPSPEEDTTLTSVFFDNDIKRCPVCSQPKYFTTSTGFEEHMNAEHAHYTPPLPVAVGEDKGVVIREQNIGDTTVVSSQVLAVL